MVLLLVQQVQAGGRMAQELKNCHYDKPYERAKSY